MSGAQKLIKLVAIALAVCLIVSIIFGIFMGITAIFSVNGKDVVIYDELVTLYESDESLSGLDIDIGASKLVIKQGDKFLVQTNNSYVKCSASLDKLIVKEDSYNLSVLGSDTAVVIYIPHLAEFEIVNIYTGAGKVEVEKIIAQSLNFEFGAGEVTLQNVVAKSIYMNTGAGKVTIGNGVLENAHLDLGVGETSITAKLLGTSTIDTGVGKLKLNIIGEAEDYTISVSKGLGKIDVFGNNVKDKSIIGMGENKIELSAGIGDIEVNIK